MGNDCRPVSLKFSWSENNNLYADMKKAEFSGYGCKNCRSSLVNVFHFGSEEEGTSVYHLMDTTIKIQKTLSFLSGSCSARTKGVAVSALEEMESIVGYKVKVRGGRR